MVTLSVVIRNVHVSKDTYVEPDGGKMGYEAKKSIVNYDLDQVLTQAVVASFIHKNRHPDEHCLVPAVGVSVEEGYIIVVLYDCERDILLTSAEIWLS